MVSGQTSSLIYVLSTCFRIIKSSLGVNSQNLKEWICQKWELQPFVILDWPINLGDLNIILSAWKRFPENYRKRCEQLFFLYQNFWKYGFCSRDWNA